MTCGNRFGAFSTPEVLSLGVELFSCGSQDNGVHLNVSILECIAIQTSTEGASVNDVASCSSVLLKRKRTSHTDVRKASLQSKVNFLFPITYENYK